jgi:membrane protease YdiL (CAAX protease family)
VAARCLACRAPMGQADTCPACGWSFAADPDAPPDPDRDTSVAGESDTAQVAGPEPGSPAVTESAGLSSGPTLTRGQLWWEVAAVLAVWVVPGLVIALTPTPAGPPPPYWTVAVELTVICGCGAFVTLYLVRRAGEPWDRFGITRFRTVDLLLVIVMFVVAEVVWVVEILMDLPYRTSSNYPFPRPSGRLDYLLMVVMYGSGAFAEEFICRAYLIVRLRDLLRSRSAAVLLAAALFASCHLYQGISGAVGAFLFGIAFGIAFLLVPRIWPLVLAHALWNIRGEMFILESGR